MLPGTGVLFRLLRPIGLSVLARVAFEQYADGLLGLEEAVERVDELDEKSHHNGRHEGAQADAFKAAQHEPAKERGENHERDVVADLERAEGLVGDDPDFSLLISLFSRYP